MGSIELHLETFADQGIPGAIPTDRGEQGGRHPKAAQGHGHIESDATGDLPDPPGHVVANNHMAGRSADHVPKDRSYTEYLRHGLLVTAAHERFKRGLANLGGAVMCVSAGFGGMMRFFTVILAGLLLLFHAAAAHEVRPTIGDLSYAQGVVTLDLQLNVEAFAAGIDLDGLTDTNVVPEAEAYDAFRALSPDDLAQVFAPVAEVMASEIPLSTSGVSPAQWRVAAMDIGPTGDPEALRDSRVTFEATVGQVSQIDVTWPAGYGTLILRQMGVEEGFTGFLDGGDSSGPINVAGENGASGWGTFVTYIPVGFDHIVPKGLDHILFVLGLFFLSLRLSALLWQISAFTLAHTVTLALGALGIVTIPASIVEPLIAASIVYVAVENIVSPQMTRWRPVLVFGFGLLHGLGFASVLGDFGLPDGHFIPALLGFNIGVELGQLAVIAVAYALVGYWFGDKPWYRAVIAIPVSVVIAAVGAFWVVERMFL